MILLKSHDIEDQKESSHPYVKKKKKVNNCYRTESFGSWQPSLTSNKIQRNRPKEHEGNRTKQAKAKGNCGKDDMVGCGVAPVWLSVDERNKGDCGFISNGDGISLMQNLKILQEVMDHIQPFHFGNSVVVRYTLNAVKSHNSKTYQTATVQSRPA